VLTVDVRDTIVVVNEELFVVSDVANDEEYVSAFKANDAVVAIDDVPKPGVIPAADSACTLN
jgi:hypothetical protein